LLSSAQGEDDLQLDTAHRYIPNRKHNDLEKQVKEIGSLDSLAGLREQLMMEAVRTSETGVC
jgi:hypothetical protein